MNFKPNKSIAWPVLMLAITLSVVVAAEPTVREVRLDASNLSPDVGELVEVSIVAELTTSSAAGIAVGIKLPLGVEFVGKEFTTFDSRWTIDSGVGVVTPIEGALDQATYIYLAGAVKKGEPSCSGTCPLATILVKGTTDGIYDIGIVQSETRALTTAQGEILFPTLRAARLTVGDVPADPVADTLDDAWEMQYFGNLDQTDSDDFDGDEISNRTEFEQGIDPTLFVGDMNGDHTITGADATRILQFLATMRDEASLGRGPDVSNDGAVTGADATRILQILAGLRTQQSVQR